MIYARLIFSSVATLMRVEEKSGRHPLAWIEAVAYVSDRRG
jgi:hypothetical protein